jgi:hypothetical protein
MDHFDEDDDTNSRYRRPRNTTYVGSYRRPGSSRYFNPSADILAGIESIEQSIGKRKQTVRDFENAASQRKLELMQSLRETEGMEDTNAMNSLQSELSRMVDDVYRLDIASFEGDRSAYNKKQSELSNVLTNLPTIIGVIDADGEAMKEAEESGVDYVKQLLRSNDEDYVAFVEDASKGGRNVGFRIEGGNVIAQLNGKDVFNANAYIKAKENGVDLVNYAKDYSEQLAAVDKKAYEGLDKFIPKTIIKKINNNEALTQEEITSYNKAVELYKKRLEESDLLTPLLNESTYQTYTEYGSDDYNDAWENSESQREDTKQAMIKKLLDNRFPVKGDFVGKRTIDETYEEDTTPLPSDSDDGDEGEDVLPSVSYVDIKYDEITSAASANNKDALSKIITTEISSTTGIDPQVEFDGDKLVITTTASTGDRAYTVDQAKAINKASREAGGSNVIDSNGMIIDQDQFEELQQANSFGPPTGKAIQKPSKTITIDDYKSEDGKSQLLNLLVRNRFTTNNDKQPAFQEVERLRTEGKQKQLSGRRAKTEKRIRQANIKQIESDAFDVANSNVTNIIKNGELNEDQKKSPWLKQAVNFIKKLPSNFIINGPNGKVEAKDYFNEDIAVEDIMFNYATVYKQVVNNPSLAPDVSFTYTSIKNAEKLDDYNLDD